MVNSIERFHHAYVNGSVTARAHDGHYLFVIEHCRFRIGPDAIAEPLEGATFCALMSSSLFDFRGSRRKMASYQHLVVQDHSLGDGEADVSRFGQVLESIDRLLLFDDS